MLSASTSGSAQRETSSGSRFVTLASRTPQVSSPNGLPLGELSSSVTGENIEWLVSYFLGSCLLVTIGEIGSSKPELRDPCREVILVFHKSRIIVLHFLL